MKIAIVGSRSINNEELVVNFINECLPDLSIVNLIISGGAKGVDTIAESFAKRNKIKTKIFLPDWNTYGKQAGFIRNSDIISLCDECIVIWDGKSKGAKHDIELCTEMNKKCYVYNLKINKKYKIEQFQLFN